MKISLKISLLLFVIVCFSFKLKKTNANVKWYTWEQAVEANKTKKKKFFIDVYTDWCGWCKVMDRETFEKDSIANYLNKNFYPIKLNAEQRDSIVFNGQTFKYIANEGGRGFNSFAYSLLDGQMQYPTVVYLTEKMERIMIAPGYKQVPELYKQLQFAHEEKYKTTAWQDYLTK